MEKEKKFNTKVKIGIALIILSFMAPNTSGDLAGITAKIIMLILGIVLWYKGYKEQKYRK